MDIKLLEVRKMTEKSKSIDRRQFLHDSAAVTGAMLGVPYFEIEGQGTYWEGGLYNTIKDYDVTYKYANGVVMTCKPGQPSMKFIGTDGWVGNRGWIGQLDASSDEIKNSVIGPDEIKLFTNPAGEHRDFLDCVKTRKDPYFPVAIGHRVSTVCHLANIAIAQGRKLKWDPDKEVFPGDPEANRMCAREMRSPWKLE